jgi:uncharacterized protein YecE (DUF72 family)
MAIARMHLGAPVWSCRDWAGTLWPAATKPSAFLAHYAKVFNAVEGNTTFYAVPRRDTITRWRDDTPPGFRFCCKLPRTITHDKALVGAERELDEFAVLLALLGDRLGPTMIQLPPTFGPRGLVTLAATLERLPAGMPFAVEPRHRGFFDGSAGHHDFEALLRERGVDRVIFDTQVLHASRDLDPLVVAARSRKPNLPVLEVATGSNPVVRIVGVSDAAACRPAFERWAVRAAAWIAQGLRPTLFVHTPDDREVPRLAAQLHAIVGAHTDVGSLPPLGVDHRAQQISLFES